MKLVIATVAALAAVLFLLPTPSATAGIIVTEGKVAHEDTRLWVNAKTACRALAAGSQTHTVSSVSSKDDGGSAGEAPTAETRDDGGSKSGSGGEPKGDLSNLDAPAPDGWVCEDIGGGIEACERTREGGQGGAPGAGDGGGLGGDGVAMTGPGEELAGCQATDQGAPWAWLVALAVLVALRRRRFFLE